METIKTGEVNLACKILGKENNNNIVLISGSIIKKRLSPQKPNNLAFVILTKEESL